LNDFHDFFSTKLPNQQTGDNQLTKPKSDRASCFTKRLTTDLRTGSVGARRRLGGKFLSQREEEIQGLYGFLNLPLSPLAYRSELVASGC